MIENIQRVPFHYKFWKQLLNRAKQKTNLHENSSPSEKHYVFASAGRKGLILAYAIKKNSAYIGLYIDRGRNCEAENRRIFNVFFKAKEEIETEFGLPLFWQAIEIKRICRIESNIAVCDFINNETQWPIIHETMINAMIRFEKVLKFYIKKIN